MKNQVRYFLPSLLSCSTFTSGMLFFTMRHPYGQLPSFGAILIIGEGIIIFIWGPKLLVSFLLAAWSQWQPHETIDPRRPYTPLVSVIIPGRNEAAGIVATLKTVLNSTYRHVEVIFIDNASTDNTEEVMQAFLAKYAYATANSPDIPVLYIRETREGKGVAMNTGILAAHGELVLTIDADSAMHEDCIAAFVEAFRHPQVMAGVGSIRVGNMQTWLGRAQFLEYMASFYLKRSESLIGQVMVMGGACACFRRSAFFEMGGYISPGPSEDFEVTVRLHLYGKKIIHVPWAVVHTEAPDTLKGLFAQRKRWKRGGMTVLVDYWQQKAYWTRRPKAHKFFFWFTLPWLIVEYVGLLMAALLFIGLVAYSLLTGDWHGELGANLLSVAVTLVLAMEAKGEDRLFLLLLAPCSLFLNLSITFIEVAALLRSVVSLSRGEHVQWLTWQRQGVTGTTKQGK